MMNCIKIPSGERDDETENLRPEELDATLAEFGQDCEIVVERELDEEETEFLNRAKKLEEKARNIREIMASKIISKEFKRTLNTNVRTMPLGEIIVNGNPASFPRLDRKRTHDSQTRSHFPTKKKITIARPHIQND